MGWASDKMIELQQEREENREALLAGASELLDSARTVGELQSELRHSREIIEALEIDLKKANSLRAKIGGWILGGIIGVLLTSLFQALTGLG